MLRPLLDMSGYESGELALPAPEEGEDAELKSVITEEDLAQMIEDILNLLNNDTPSEHVLAALTPVLPPLFRLFCAATMGKANIRAGARLVAVLRRAAFSGSILSL